MPWYGILLFPFSLLFRWITSLRNFLYDYGIMKSYPSPMPTLVVGNLSVGGSGKTPMVEFLVKNFSVHTPLATLSRGYGRKTKGFLEANPSSHPQEIGDEPLQIYKKFQGKIPVFVGEDRVNALNRINQLSLGPELVILDDAFQHRRLTPHFKILLTPYSRPFFKDELMPSGLLRESRFGARRADMIVVTKCPLELSEVEKSVYKNKIAYYAGQDKPIFFSSIAYGDPISVTGNQFQENASVFLVSGLADDRLFVDYCKRRFSVTGSISFPDHQKYGWKEENKLVTALRKVNSGNSVILTTEKDSEKLKSLTKQGLLKEIPIFALPIEVIISQDEQESLLSILREKLNIK
jgi:tetraacyldisaccharide 4'-kinase